MVALRVRPMGVEDLDVRIGYFQEATDEHLELIGVDRLQAAGFTYVSTQRTTPAPLNVEQITNLWVFLPST